MKAESFTRIVVDDVSKICATETGWDTLREATVLITGASGMLPMYCTKVLLGLNDTRDLNIKVKALVRNRKRAEEVFGPDLERSDFELIVGDVTDPKLDLGKVDHVIHGASAARPSEHNRDPVATLRANIAGTDLLLQRHVKAKTPGAFLLMSSSEVYGSQDERTTSIGENSYGGIDLLSPRASYSEGKRAAETLTAVYSHQYRFAFRNLRFGHIYGPGMRLDDGRVQADFARDALNGQDIVLLSAGLAMRTYTYVADAVLGLFMAWLHGKNGAYNVADGGGKVTIRDLASFFAAAAVPNVDVAYQDDPSEEGTFNPELVLALDSTKLMKLGWAPSTGLARGTARMVAHLREVHGRTGTPDER